MRKLRPRETWGSHVATINSNFEELNAAALISEKYHVFLNQSGTDAPVATLIKDNTLTDVVLSRSEVGTFLLTKEGAFPVGRTVPKVPVVGYTPQGDKLLLTPVSENVFKLETFAAADTEVLADGALTDQELYLEIFDL